MVRNVTKKPKLKQQQQQKLVIRDPYQEPHCIVLASVAEEAEGRQKVLNSS